MLVLDGSQISFWQFAVRIPGMIVFVEAGQRLENSRFLEFSLLTLLDGGMSVSGFARVVGPGMIIIKFDSCNFMCLTVCKNKLTVLTCGASCC